MYYLKEYLGRTIKDERLRQNLAMRDVSSVAGVSLGYLSEVERGIKDPSSKFINNVSMALGMGMSELLLRTLTTIERDNRSKSWH
jgi:transcriptional regulator with XRE-family HTH domain